MDELRAGMDLLAEPAPAEMERHFATVGTVYEDGIALIFDGESEESEKHYLCNTGVTFAAGDRVRILRESGTYIVEYVVGPPGGGGGGGSDHGIPAGGSAGQMLVKASGTDYDAAWQNVPTELPSGGDAGQVLTKTSGGNAWQDVPAELPTGGTAGQVLTKTADGNAWQNVPKELPTSGASVAGRPLLATNGGSEWKEYIPQKFFNHAQSSVGGNDNYIIELKTGGISGTAASEFYIRMGTTGTWHKITTT